MTKLRVAVIGTGKRKQKGDPTGYGMAYHHADAYLDTGKCELVSCCDIVEANAKAFADAYSLPKFYTDYREMIKQESPDMVSVCTWPSAHAEIVINCARLGVRGIHCEKPMADTWSSAKAMHQECKEHGVQLTFDHQRRFGKPFRLAKQLLEKGEIGKLLRLEARCGDIYDFGTHYVDMFGFYNKELPAEWVMGQIDYSVERLAFGMPLETSGIYLWKYTNGVFGFIATGVTSEAVTAQNKLIGEDGVIEVGATSGENLRLRRYGSPNWEVIDTEGEGMHLNVYFKRAISDVVDALLEGREPELSSDRALKATEIIFACYESSRRRGLVKLPLDIGDNPLRQMIDSGALRAKPVKQTA